ncbi:phosphoethanolamine transferase domain-containing protein, partial [Lysobacter sp. 2RAB21]
SANGSFWRAIAKAGALSNGNGVLIAVCLFVAIVAITMLLLGIVLNRWTVKPVLTLVLLVTAAAAYFMNQYGVYLDTGMIRNVMQSDTKESRELFTWSMILSVLLYGALPAALLWRVRIKRKPLGRALAIRLGVLLGLVLI